MRNLVRAMMQRTGLRRDVQWTRFLLRWMTVAFFLHLIAVTCSQGFFHADEHFQILEFLNFKLGKSPASDLPIEFHMMLRPWMQPAIYTALTTLWTALKIDDPFKWALSFRLIAACIGWLTVVGLSLLAYIWFPDRKWRNWSVILLSTLWFLPALHARHSSENMGGSLFLLGVCFLLLLSPARRLDSDHPESLPPPVAWITGILLGFGFEFRFQTAILIFGFLAWLLIIAQVRLKQLLPLLGGIAIPIALGVFVDRWGYGTWTFTPWNYFHWNILQNHVADVDASPFYDYLRRAFTESWPFLGILVLLSMPVAWIRHPRHVLCWSAFPFFLVHMVIGHKELRFLFPLVLAAPIFLIQALYSERTHKLDYEKMTSRPWFVWSMRVLLGWNAVALIALTTLPAWTPIRFYKNLYFFRAIGFELHYVNDQPFQILGTALNFYRPANLTMISMPSFEELARKIEMDDRPIFYFQTRLEFPEQAGVLKDWCKPKFSTLPAWISKFNIAHLMDNVTNWTLFECAKPNKQLILDTLHEASKPIRDSGGGVEPIAAPDGAAIPAAAGAPADGAASGEQTVPLPEPSASAEPVIDID
ncbi:MAG: hypothetical protein ACXVCH_02120 [Bdellovibrionota bacterium]